MLNYSTLAFTQAAGDNLFDNTFLHQINLEAPGLEDILPWSMPGTYDQPVKMTIDGIVVNSIHIRRKGYTSNEGNNTNPPFKIDVDRFIVDQEYDGIDKFNLLNQLVNSNHYQNNALANSLYRRAGVAAPHTSFAEVYINGEFIDIYNISEDIENTFLKQNFASSDGSLYKGVEFPPNGVNVQNGTINEFNNYIDNVNPMNWGDYVDLHNLFRVITVDHMINDDPGGQNNVMYFEPKLEKMYAIPWDKNLSFSGVPFNQLLSPNVPFLEGQSFSLINDPLIKPIYLQTVCDLTSYLLDSTFVEEEVMHNYDILGTNTQGIVISSPQLYIDFLSETKDSYTNALATLGFQNCSASNISFPLNNTDIVINEFVAKSDQNGVQEPNGGTPDWIELYNNTNADIALNAKFYLSDDKDFLKKWHFEQEETIPANGYLILWADRDVHQSGIHTNFKIGANGGDLFMTYEDMTIVQEISYTQQELNKAYARVPNGIGDFTIQNHTFNATNESVLNTMTNNENNIISIYPNPSSGVFYINGLDLTKKGTFIISNSLGQNVLTSPSTEFMELNNLTNGMYFLLIKYDNEIKSFNLIINKR